MELVGYRTSHKGIWDIYHSVYLLRRSPGLPPYRSQQRREAMFPMHMHSGFPAGISKQMIVMS